MQAPARRRRLSGADRHESLLDVALVRFADAGYGSVSVGEIAAASGVTKPVVYEHFDSKAQLYVELLSREGERLTGILLAGYDPEAELRRRLHTLVGDALRYTRRRPDSVRLLLQEPLGEPEVAGAHEQIRSVARTAISTAILLDPLFEAAPGFSRRASAALLADLQVALLGRVLRWAIDHPGTSTPALADFLVSLLWSGIGS
jgi:AcrR family transcriptional regulator